MSVKSQIFFTYLYIYLNTFAKSEIKFKSVPTTVKSFENESILLPCYIDENTDQLPRVKWWKYGTLLGDTMDPHHLLPLRFRLWANSSLQVTELKATDTGDYTCEVIRSEPWTSINQTHTIEVQYAPVISTIPEDGFVEVRKGEYVDIGCNITGTPQPKLSWNKNGEPMALLEQRSKIRFKADHRLQGGTYECLATNGVGPAVKGTINVVVQDAPEVIAKQSYVHTTPGLRAVLEAVVISAPPADTTWYKDGAVHRADDDRVINIVTENLHQLIIRNVRTFDLGNYTFRAENKLGMADVSFRLTGTPNIASFKVDPNINKPTATSFVLLWEVDSYSTIIEYNLWLRPYIGKLHEETTEVNENQWRKIVIPGDSTDGPIHSTSYLVRGLTPSTVYEAMVTSRNTFGWSKTSAVLHFATEPGVRNSPSTSDYKELSTPLILEEEITITNSSGLRAQDTSDSTKLKSTSGFFLLFGTISLKISLGL